MNTLTKKAVADAGFDLVEDVGLGWSRCRVSGTDVSVWVRSRDDGVAVALPTTSLLAEVGTLVADASPPSSAPFAALVQSSADLLASLRRVRLVLVATPDALADQLASRVDRAASTEVAALVKRRVGQELFRSVLMDYWAGQCAVTGVDLPEVLRASHAKPWKCADDRERLDVHNGLLLAAHLDALFDRGLLTFDEVGRAHLGGGVSLQVREALGLAGAPVRLRWVTAAHQRYLEYHRKQVFRP